MVILAYVHVYDYIHFLFDCSLPCGHYIRSVKKIVCSKTFLL